MKKSKLIRLVVLLIIVSGILISFLIYNAWPIIFGDKLILDTVAYDPFDPLRGQYMQIRYEISTLEGNNFIEGDNICVLLEKDKEGISRPKDISKNKFENGDFICGKVKSIYNNDIRVEYDIERFYFERKADVPSQNITVEVSVSSNGKPRLIQLLQNGKPIEIEYKSLSWKS